MKTSIICNLAFLGMMVFGCTNAEDPTTSSAPLAAPAPSGCATIATSECSNSTGCMPVIGMRVDLEQMCVVPKEAVACVESTPCPGSVRFAVSPSGELWQFPLGCTPPGWSIGEPMKSIEQQCPDRPEDSECSQLWQQACQGNGKCIAIEGQRVDTTRHCVDEKTFVACEDAVKCAGRVAYAQSPSGELWRFHNGCSPKDWAIAPSQEPMELCPPAPPPADRCIQLDETKCQESKECMAVYGYRINESLQCMEDTEYVTCMLEGACPPRDAYARSPSGELWGFQLGCFPPGWQHETGKYFEDACQ